MTKRIIDGERWLAERARFLREQLETGDITDNQRTLIETELTAGCRWLARGGGSDGNSRAVTVRRSEEGRAREDRADSARRVPPIPAANERPQSMGDTPMTPSHFAGSHRPRVIMSGPIGCRLRRVADLHEHPAEPVNGERFLNLML